MDLLYPSDSLMPAGFSDGSNEFSNVLNIFEMRSELALSQKNMIFRIKITKIEFSVVKLKFPDQK